MCKTGQAKYMNKYQELCVSKAFVFDPTCHGEVSPSAPMASPPLDKTNPRTC